MANYPTISEQQQQAKRDAVKEQVVEILEVLTKLCKKRAPLQHEPSTLHQNLCRNSGVLPLVLRVVRLRQRVHNVSVSVTRQGRVKVHNEILKKLQGHCSTFLKSFVYRNPTNQHLLHRHIDFFMERLDAGGSTDEDSMLLEMLFDV